MTLVTLLAYYKLCVTFKLKSSPSSRCSLITGWTNADCRRRRRNGDLRYYATPVAKTGGSGDGLNVTDLSSPPDVGGRCVVALLATGPAQLFELAVDGTPNLRATYPEVPWFAGSAQLAGLLVRLASGNTTIQVSAFGQSKKL